MRECPQSRGQASRWRGLFLAGGREVWIGLAAHVLLLDGRGIVAGRGQQVGHFRRHVFIDFEFEH